MRAYADTNFFCRLYLDLTEAAQTRELLKEAEAGRSPPLPVTWLHRLETVNAFELYVFAGKHEGRPRVTREQAAIAQATFREDIRNGELLRAVQIDIHGVQLQFEELALRHTAKHGFRSYDVLHVASALVLSCDTFWSFDPKASKLASLEGLRTQ